MSGDNEGYDTTDDEGNYDNGNNDPFKFGGNGESKKKSKPEIRKIPIYKYSGNGRLPLYESVIIGLTPKFVTMQKDKLTGEDFTLLDYVDTKVKVERLIPKGNIDTQSPLSYTFLNSEELSYYLKLARTETLDTLMLKVDRELRKYVNAEEHYYVIMAADLIWSYFQDRFPLTHYLIFVGDNGSGKNSALLFFKSLGYRVFYILSASASNYFTAMGNREEGQVCIAEDEVEDIADPSNKEKRNALKAGYCSGASVPKIELEGGRSQDNWLVYSHKWLALEELKEDRYTKGILDRSFKLKMIYGDVPYNIKEVLRGAGDPEYEELQRELNHLRKILFCYRLLHHNDQFLKVKLNVKGRSAELTNPLIRLFRNSPIALQRILECLSMFMKERNETSTDSFESKLYNAVESLIIEREARSQNPNPTDEDNILKPYQFTNQSIRDKLVEITEAEVMEDTSKKGMYYSPEVGAFSQTKISSILRSKFKVKKLPNIRIGKITHRCVEFNPAYLKRIKASYDIPDKIMIIDPNNNANTDTNSNSENVTPVTPVTPLGHIEGYDNEGQKGAKTPDFVNITKIQIECIKTDLTECNNSNTEGLKSDQKGVTEPSRNQIGVTPVTSVTDQKPEEPEPDYGTIYEKPRLCRNCHRMISPFNKNIHLACCLGSC